MNTRSLLLAATLAATSLAGFAESPLTRGEVRAEMDTLRAVGALPSIGEASPSQLDANLIDARVARLQAEDAPSAAPESLMFVSPTGTVIIIETLPPADAR